MYAGAQSSRGQSRPNSPLKNACTPNLPPPTLKHHPPLSPLSPQGPGGQSSPSVAGPSSPSGSRRVHYGNAPNGRGAGGNGVPTARSPSSGMRTNESSPTSQRKSTLLGGLKRPPSPRTNKKIADLCAQMCSKMSTAVQVSEWIEHIHRCVGRMLSFIRL